MKFVTPIKEEDELGDGRVNMMIIIAVPWFALSSMLGSLNWDHKQQPYVTMFFSPSFVGVVTRNLCMVAFGQAIHDAPSSFGKKQGVPLHVIY